jgi:hypothetical protein
MSTRLRKNDSPALAVPVVWAAAQREGRFLIPQDLDFSDVRRYQPGTHHGLLLVRLQAPGRNALLQRIRGLFSDEDTSGWQGCFIVATDRKLRVRRPDQGRHDSHQRGTGDHA